MSPERQGRRHWRATPAEICWPLLLQRPEEPNGFKRGVAIPGLTVERHCGAAETASGFIIWGITGKL